MFRRSQKYHRLKYIMQDDIPTKSQIQRSLGTSLAQVFFDYNHHEAIKLLDTVSSKVLQQSYTIAHSDRLKVNAIPTWSEKQEILKSNIHRDILTLGEDILKKFQVEVEETTQSKLSNEFTKKCYMLEAEKRLALTRNSEEIHAKYENYIKLIQQDLERKLQIDSANTNAKHSKELQKAIIKTRSDTTHNILKKMRSEMCYIITCLHNDFEQSHRAQRENIIADFNKIMRKEHIKLDTRIKEVEKKKAEELYIQRRELEIQNAIDIIYVLCMERLHNSSQMQTLHKHFEKKIKFLQEFVVKQDEAINIMKKWLTEYYNKNTKLQQKINTTINEFQKFINFAFDAVPGQCDFLLSQDLPFINDNDIEDIKQEKSHD